MDQERIDTYHALELANEAFEKHLVKCGYDTAYWAIRLTTWMLSADEFHPLEKIELDTRSQSDGKYHEET